MAKDPAFLFYSSDFLVGTYAMSDIQVGQYIRLMCLQHQQGHLNEDTMRSVMHGEMDAKILSKYKIDGDGCYYNERLETEIIRRKDYSKSRSDNRAAKNTSTHVKDMINICDSYDVHMETVTEAVTDTISGTESGTEPVEEPSAKSKAEARFNTLWNLYPRKEGKKEALASYERDVKKGATDGQMKCGIEAYIVNIKALGTEYKYIKQGSTFFSQQAWNDDYSSKGYAKQEPARGKVLI